MDPAQQMGRQIRCGAFVGVIRLAVAGICPNCSSQKFSDAGRIFADGSVYMHQEGQF